MAFDHVRATLFTYAGGCFRGITARNPLLFYRRVYIPKSEPKYSLLLLLFPLTTDCTSGSSREIAVITIVYVEDSGCMMELLLLVYSDYVFWKSVIPSEKYYKR